MTLETHHKWALVGAALTSAIALTDAVTHGLTSGFSPFSDDSDLAALVAVGDVVHGLTYVALAAVLVLEADRFRSANGVARVARRVVLASLAVLALGFVFVAPFVALGDHYDSSTYVTFGFVAGPAFFGMIFGSLALGLAVLRIRSLGVGARVLALMLPVLGVTLLLQWLVPLWAHPAYLETTLHFGLALIGVGAVTAQPATRDAIASPTTAV